MEAEFDELSLDVEIEYHGDPVQLTNHMPSLEGLASGAGVAALSHYIIHQSADQVKQRNRHWVVRPHFDLQTGPGRLTARKCPRAVPGYFGSFTVLVLLDCVSVPR